MTAEEFGERLKRLRLDAGLSQLELGLQSESLSQAYIGAMEKGTKFPTIATLDKIAYGFEMTLSELIGEDEPQVKYDPSIHRIIAYAHTLTPDQRDFMIEFMKSTFDHFIKK